MSIKSKLTTLSVAVIGTAMMSATALAAQATTALNVRSGPGTGYPVVDVLSAGEEVDIRECRGSWCYVIKSGPDGWASSRYLTQDDGGRSPSRPEPDVGFSIDVPGFSFSFGNGADFDRRPIRRTGQVCFYEDWNFRGSRFCAEPGDRYRRLNEFNDRISSIRVTGGAEVQVCENFKFQGRCAVLDRNIRRLTGRNNDAISSLRVR